MQSSPHVGSQGTPGGDKVCQYVIFHNPDADILVCEQKITEQTIRPITIRQILNAEHAHSDAETYVDGFDVKQVHSQNLSGYTT